MVGRWDYRPILRQRPVVCRWTARRIWRPLPKRIRAKLAVAQTAAAIGVVGSRRLSPEPVAVGRVEVVLRGTPLPLPTPSLSPEVPSLSPVDWPPTATGAWVGVRGIPL